MYFSIPWALGTVMSSVALGLENQPNFPTYPRVSVPWTIIARSYALLTCSVENDFF